MRNNACQVGNTTPDNLPKSVSYFHVTYESESVQYETQRPVSENLIDREKNCGSDFFFLVSCRVSLDISLMMRGMNMIMFIK